MPNVTLTKEEIGGLGVAWRASVKWAPGVTLVRYGITVGGALTKLTKAVVEQEAADHQGRFKETGDGE